MAARKPPDSGPGDGPAGPESGGERPQSAQKRMFLRSILSPLAALAGRYQSPAATAAAPSERRLRPDAEAHVMAMLGPLGRGAPAAGSYQLLRVTVAADRVDLIFELITSPEPRAADQVAVALLALATVEGVTHATTRSLRLVVTGGAPVFLRNVVGDHVAEQLRKHDDGSLWVPADR